MISWTPYETNLNIQVIPDGEEDMHHFSLVCGCCPYVSEEAFNGKYIVMHRSYDRREIFDKLEETPFHRVRQKVDC